MKLNQSISGNNFRAFLWHAVFLALAINFIDMDTVISSMLVNAGGNAFSLFFLPYLDCTRKEDNPVVSAPENPVV